MYKMNFYNKESITRLSDGVHIPKEEKNRYYREFLINVAEQGIGIVEGEDIVSDEGITTIGDVPDWVQEEADKIEVAD